MQLFSTKMSAWELTKMSKMMFLFARGEQYITRSAETRFGMGSTPLNEALVCATTIVPLFKKSYNLDIVNLFVLTDGDGNSRITGVMKEGLNKKTQIGNFKRRLVRTLLSRIELQESRTTVVI